MSLLLQIILLLFATLIFAPLAKRYASTPVLGYLMAGLLLGSGVFNLIDDAGLISQLTDLGMVMLMLFLGFAFKPQQLWVQRHNLMINSGLPLLLSIIFLVSASFFILQDFLKSMILGFALALSSITLVQQLLQNKIQINSKLGQTALPSLQLHTLFAVVLIGLFPLLEDTASTQHGIAYFAAIIATISGLFLASRYLVRPAFRFLAHRHSIELIPVLGLLIVLSVLLIIDILNIHVLIGAFLAGILLAETEFKVEVERIISPFRDAAIGLLFLAIGLGLSLTPLLQSPLFILGSIVGLLLIKATMIAASSYYQHRSAKFSLGLSILLAQSGELSFILLKIAETEQLLSKEILQPTLLIIFGSMLLTPLLYWLMNAKILPLVQKKAPEHSQDVPQHPILIVGFGRFGQVIARVLHMQGRQFSVMDSNQPDADFIEQYGHHFLDADVTKVENLRAAGIEYCKLLIIAIDDVEDSMNLARHLCLNYPDLSLLVRARDRHHAHLLHDLGIQHVWRETYLSSLDMAQQALVETGYSTEDAQVKISQFQQQDQQLLKQSPWYHDQYETMDNYPHALAELEYLFENMKIVSPERVPDDQATQTDAKSPHETS
ncbi:cation:proton antiporter [Acinetobacter corruptisaponis]|uniref:Cation:proton antiporter n=1 Tax=Acinetobacter corruptisaponis TaxID=3045147 RepID=A0ABY8S9Q1_9GAMM|nr:cation:proton antiporter [Acinetobacter sp. KCTC 92772]WHP07557.1 cation:proton antiporter [Acinetobacter sp. KCTC 92772]